MRNSVRCLIPCRVDRKVLFVPLRRIAVCKAGCGYADLMGARHSVLAPVCGEAADRDKVHAVLC